MAKKTPSRFDETNAESAWIIMQNPTRYEGLPLLWAQLWIERHGQPRKPVAKAERTVKDRLEAHDERQRKKKIARRRERWAEREWRTSRKSNRFTRVHGFQIVVFCRNTQYAIGISDRAAGQMTFGAKRYTTEAQAQAAAFDALLYMEGKRAAARPEFLRKAVA